ncbi:MAG TPA: hypothetical protein VMG41_07630 [Gemmatimonadales bacterium]|nr:hypothetical protein [Gemmatimonadales bacterium]
MPEGDLKARNPALAGVLSFLMPGLGQVYNGQLPYAIAFFVIVYGSTLICGIRFIGALGAPDPRAGLGKVMFWGGIATFVWLGGVVHAVFAALDRSEYFLLRYNRIEVYLGLLIVAYVLVPVTMSGAIFRWMLAQNGIRSPAQVAEWQGRMAALRGGVAVPRQAPESTTAANNVQIPIELPDPEVAARGAATAIHLVLVGGPDGGVYDMHSAQPSCVFQAGSAPSWTSLYANPADSQGVTALQFRVATDTGTTTSFQVNVNIGNVPTGRAYFVEGRNASEGGTQPSATVAQRDSGAVIRIVGETPQRVRIEATIQCRRIVRE